MSWNDLGMNNVEIAINLISNQVEHAKTAAIL